MYEVSYTVTIPLTEEANEVFYIYSQKTTMVRSDMIKQAVDKAMIELMERTYQAAAEAKSREYRYKTEIKVEINLLEPKEVKE